MNHPKHVAIIMDGNGRWALARGMPRYSGHRAGADSARAVVRVAGETGVKVLTLFTLSEDNMRRSKVEVDFIIALLDHFLVKERQELKNNNVCLRVIGNTESLPPKTQYLLAETIEYLCTGAGLVLNIALNYHGRSEISKACQQIAKLVLAGELKPEEITPDAIGKHLQTADLPEPDLLIRTGGEQRISNFLLWQLAYTEFYFTPTMWPRFRAKEFRQAIDVFRKRERRYGLELSLPPAANIRRGR